MAAVRAHRERWISGALRGQGVAYASIALFLLSTGGATLAAHFDRPVTSALIYVLGVTIIGAISGIRGGLIAAIAAAFIHNFFLREPVLQISAASADEYIPFIVFNLSAVISGMLAGRLKDRAHLAERAQARLNVLLVVSDRLQKVVLLPDLVTAMNSADIRPWLGRFELYDDQGRNIGLPPDGPRWRHLATQPFEAQCIQSEADRASAYRLGQPGRALGIAIFGEQENRSGSRSVDMEALAALLSMTVERCLLLERLSRTEAVRRSEELKTALLSSLSHDMRTPLSAISTSASSLLSLSGDLDPAVRLMLLQTIKEQCERLDRYTANLLDLGRLQTGIDAEQLIEVDIVEVLGTVLRSTRALSASHAIAKQIDSPSAIVRANPVMVEQIFRNLLDNAVRYSPEGSTIAVKMVQGNALVRIEIIDQGCGVPKDELPHLFDRFYRSSRTQHQEGHGLGLSIARGFVEAFGGWISVDSPHAGGIGTQVIVEIPLSRQHVGMVHG